MNKKRTILTAVVLLLVLIIGGLMAYFTDMEDKHNTFTVGNVAITLSEPAWETAVTGGAAKSASISPNVDLPKDPTITNDSTTNPVYVFLKVAVPCYDAGYTSGTVTRDTDAFDFIKEDGTVGTNDGWVLVQTGSINPTTGDKEYLYAYAAGTGSNQMTAVPTAGSVDNNDDPTNSTTPLFNSIKFKDITNEEASTIVNNYENDDTNAGADEKQVYVKAYGIQTTDLAGNTPAQIFALFGAGEALYTNN